MQTMLYNDGGSLIQHSANILVSGVIGGFARHWQVAGACDADSFERQQVCVAARCGRCSNHSPSPAVWAHARAILWLASNRPPLLSWIRAVARQ